jgi:hypothetical protein
MRRHPSDAICSADLDGSIGYEPRDQELTHIIDCNAVAVRRNEFRARCGRLVDGHLYARNGVPTCEECRVLDEEDERSLLALQQMPPAERPVTSTWFDPTADARPKGSRR